MGKRVGEVLGVVVVEEMLEAFGFFLYLPVQYLIGGRFYSMK